MTIDLFTILFFAVVFAFSAGILYGLVLTRIVGAS